MNYNYWNGFVIDWTKGYQTAIGGWSDPNNILFNDSAKKDPSSDFIPEPWWGNDGSSPLHSVIINFNPGKGEDIQRKGNLPVISSYANDVVLSGLLPKTDCWHCKHRALPILNSLKRLGCMSGPVSTHDSLSIELIPWHTKGVDSAYWDYVNQNASIIFDSVIRFAANESLRITNNKLKSVVLLKMNETNILRLLRLFRKQASVEYSIKKPKKTTASGNACYLEFAFDALPNNRFVALWGKQTRNNLPNPKDLDEILTAI